MTSSIRVAGRASLLVVARLGGAGAMLLAQVLIARLLGAAALAEYLILIAVTNTVAALIPLGFADISPYFVAEYDADGRRGRLRGFLAAAAGVTAVVGAIVAAAAAVLHFRAAPSLHPLLPTASLAACALVAPLFAWLRLGTDVAIGLRLPFLGMLPDLLLRPLAFLAAVVAAILVPSWRMAGIVVIAGAAIGLVAAAQALLLRRVLAARGAFAETPRYEPARWGRFAPAWFATGLIVDFFFDVDLLLLTPLLPGESLAVFGAAVRIFGLLTFGLTTIYALLLPELFASGAAGETAATRERLRQVNYIATLAALACLAFAALAGRPILSIFGPGFAEGHAALMILTASLLVRAVFGPAHVLLSLRDRPYAGLPVLVAGLALLVLANRVLVPTHGVAGAALAASLTMAFWAAGQWLMAAALTGQNSALFGAFGLSPRESRA